MAKEKDLSVTVSFFFFLICVEELNPDPSIDIFLTFPGMMVSSRQKNSEKETEKVPRKYMISTFRNLSSTFVLSCLP